jgi:hypothetical protein
VQNRLLYVSSFTLVTLLVVAAVGNAQESGRRSGQLPPRAVQGQAGSYSTKEDPILKGLTLTQAQRSQMDQIRAKYRAKRRDRIVASMNTRKQAAQRASKPLTVDKNNRKPVDFTDLYAAQKAEMRTVLLQEQKPAFDRNAVDLEEMLKVRRGSKQN